MPNRWNEAYRATVSRYPFEKGRTEGAGMVVRDAGHCPAESELRAAGSR